MLNPAVLRAHRVNMYIFACKDLADMPIPFNEHAPCNVMVTIAPGTTHSNTHTLFVVFHTGYKEGCSSLCVYKKLELVTTWYKYWQMWLHQHISDALLLIILVTNWMELVTTWYKYWQMWLHQHISDALCHYKLSYTSWWSWDTHISSIPSTLIAVL